MIQPNAETARNVAFLFASMSQADAAAGIRQLIGAVTIGMIDQGHAPHDALAFARRFTAAVIDAMASMPPQSAARH